MRRWIVLSALALSVATTDLYASTYTLKKLLKQIKKDDALFLSAKHEKEAMRRSREAFGSGDPWEAGAQVGYADPIGDTGALEFGVEISKRFLFSDVKEMELEAMRLRDEAQQTRKSVQLQKRYNEIAKAYHLYCTERERYKVLQKRYDTMKRVYRAKEAAFRYDEASKLDLMQIKMSLDRIGISYEDAKRQAQAYKRRLAYQARVEPKKIRFACNDLYEIRENPKIDTPFALTKKAYELSQQSIWQRIKRYKKGPDSYEVSLQATEEIDTKRFGVGVRIPLNFSSSRYEKKRASLLEQKRALEYAFKDQIRQKNARLQELKHRIEGTVIALRSLQKSISALRSKFSRLTRLALDSGEISVSEYLLLMQKLTQSEEMVFEYKQRYYAMLFELLGLSEQGVKQ